MHRNPKAPSLARRVVVSVSLGFLVALAGASAEHLIEGTPVWSLSVVDDVVVGVITGLFVFAYEQQQHRAVLNKIRVIAEMNHHVRNALQAITYAPYAEQAKQIPLIEASVQRIQWALREILPGEMEESQQVEDRSAGL